MDATFAIMFKSLVLGSMLATAAGVLVTSAQPAGRRPALTGTVVAVNQQSDSVTLSSRQPPACFRIPTPAMPS